MRPPTVTTSILEACAGVAIVIPSDIEEIVRTNIIVKAKGFEPIWIRCGALQDRVKCMAGSNGIGQWEIIEKGLTRRIESRCGNDVSWELIAGGRIYDWNNSAVGIEGLRKITLALQGSGDCSSNQIIWTRNGKKFLRPEEKELVMQWKMLGHVNGAAHIVPRIVISISRAWYPTPLIEKAVCV